MAKKSLNMIEKMMDPNIIDYYIINCAIPSIYVIVYAIIAKRRRAVRNEMTRIGKCIFTAHPEFSCLANEPFASRRS